MQQTTKFTLGFLDLQLRNLSEFTFKIDKESKAILGIIAKHGPATETKITNLGKRRTILSRDIIRRRILTTDLSNDFLSVKKGKKIGNLKGKHQKLYSLTFKGLLASLYETPLQENIWIKNYLNVIKEITDDITVKAFLEHVYYAIITFLILNSNKKGSLTDYKDPEEDIFDNYYMEGRLQNIMWQDHVKEIPKEYRELFVYCVTQFFVSCEVIGSLVKDTLPKNFDEEYEYDIIEYIFRGWIWSMFFGLNKTVNQIIEKHLKNEDYDEEEEWSFKDYLGDEINDNIRFMAADEFHRIKPKGKLSSESLFQS